MSNKRVIADQVLYRIYGGVPDSAAPVQLPDVYKALEQKINAQFALRHFQVTLPNAQTIPDNLAIATYTDVTVLSTGNGKSYSTLPIIPISLPRSLGVQEIRPVIGFTGNTRMLGNPFIPLQYGQGFLLNADKLLNELFGQIAYEVSGKTVTYSKDLINFGVSKVDMRLVVFDMSQYAETDELPIPSDYEEALINELVLQFSAVVPESGIVNSYTVAGQQPQVQPKK